MRQALGLLYNYEREENYAVHVVSALAGNLAALLALHREQSYHARTISRVWAGRDRRASRKTKRWRCSARSSCR